MVPSIVSSHCMVISDFVCDMDWHCDEMAEVNRYNTVVTGHIILQRRTNFKVVVERASDVDCCAISPWIWAGLGIINWLLGLLGQSKRGTVTITAAAFHGLMYTIHIIATERLRWCSRVGQQLQLKRIWNCPLSLSPCSMPASYCCCCCRFAVYSCMLVLRIHCTLCRGHSIVGQGVVPTL